MVTPTLTRETFTFSREMEFFTERELTAQMGISKHQWLLAILKELIDNALDACETAGVNPEICVRFDASENGDIITISDNGPGLSADVIKKVLDFKTRTSDKEAYRSPTRGQQGNALKTILAIPFVLSGKESRMIIESQGIRHDIRIRLDLIKQCPVPEYETSEIVKTQGCAITVYTSINLDNLDGLRLDFLQILSGFTTFNPHLKLTILGVTDVAPVVDRPTNTNFTKWKPSDPTSPHWYSQSDMQHLIAAYIAKGRDSGRDYTLREFISQFRGLSSTQRQKKITGQFSGTKRLSDLVKEDRLDTSTINLLLAVMQRESKQVPPDILGIIGEAHFKQGNNNIKYHCYKHKGDIPFIIEAALIYDKDLTDPVYKVGINFSPSYSDPFSRDLIPAKYRGDSKHAWGIKGIADEFKLTQGDGAYLIVHVVHPSLAFHDRGKTQISSSGFLVHELGNVLSEVLKAHCASKNKEVKQQQEQERQERRESITMREAVFAVMQEAANNASGNGALPYSVRQLYYQVRPLIQLYTDKELDYAYFTPPLVTDYEDIYGPLKGLIYDDRGHLYEPHRENFDIGLGTREVEAYQIPDYEYDKILYIEKEGFNEIFKAARLGQRYDMAIMSTKGYACRAAKQLLARATGKDITILCAHDADEYGYEIARTLEEETRTSKGLNIRIIDIGLKVQDALAMGLEPEVVNVKRKMSEALLRRITIDEYDFLSSKRIELNAMSTEQLVTWIEKNLEDNGLASKLVPPEDAVKEEIESAWDESETLEDEVRHALEEIIGCSISELTSDVREEIGKPELNGCYDELKKELEPRPATYWRNWAKAKALTIESKHIDNKREAIKEFIKSRLENGPTEDED